MKGKISGSRIFPSTATQCSEEIGSFFSLRAVEILWGENSSSFQILQEGSSAAEEILEVGTHILITLAYLTLPLQRYKKHCQLV